MLLSPKKKKKYFKHLLKSMKIRDPAQRSKSEAESEGVPENLVCEAVTGSWPITRCFGVF